MNELGQFFCLHRRFLVYNLVVRNLKVRYRKSFFGFLWTLIVPASMTLVYFFVFKYVARIGDEDYPLLLLSGIIPWTFFSTTLTTGTDALVNNFGILSKVPISISAFPLADACSSFVNFLLSLPALFIVAIVFRSYPQWSWLALPLIFFCLFLQSYSLALLLAVSNVYLRDVRHLVTIVIQIWLYLTPILYSTSMIPAAYRKWFYVNPLFAIFDSIHIVILKGNWPGPAEWGGIVGWTALMVILAFVVNLRFRFRLVERL